MKILSILTVVYNDPSIEKTIESIISKKNDSIEFIVIDGGSTDITISIINKYIKYIDYFISEKDDGIYDAMNKAVAASNGEFVLHLNCGDALLEIPLDDLILNLDSDVGAIAYPCKVGENELFIPSYTKKIKLMNTLHHQSTFYRKKYVFYDTRYKVFADFDLNQRLYKASRPVEIKLNPCVSTHKNDGIASTGKYRWDSYKVLINNQGVLYLIIYFIYRFFIKTKNVFSRK